MQICKKCVLPETYPGITFDENGVCNYCNNYRGKEASVSNDAADEYFTDENQLIQCLESYKRKDGQYDVLVPVSGGVDSCSALIRIVEKFKLNPLVFHNDHGYEDDTATYNVRKLCRVLNVDMILWQLDFDFMKKMWKFVIESNVEGVNACYICGNILYLNAVEIAHKFNIKLVINGYTKGMAPILTDKIKGRKIFDRMVGEMLKLGDKPFLDKFLKKNEWLNKQNVVLTKKDLVEGINNDKILVIPFYIFDFYKTDKDKLRKICQDRFDWKPIKTTYPARTTNCEINWLNAFMDLKKMNYTFYHDEYSNLIRAGEMTREQVLKDLAFNPPEGLIERLSKELNLNSEKNEKNLSYASNILDNEDDFEF